MTVAIRDAATVLVVRRDADGASVLMGMRGAGAAFMPSKFVFPGGAVDPEDAQVALARPLGPTCRARLLQEEGLSSDAIAAAALRELAESGILERKRKSGTRVALHPVSRAVIAVQIVRREIEDRGANYGYALIDKTVDTPPHAVTFAMELAQAEDMLHVRAVHLADGVPYALEYRWISLRTVPQARDFDFVRQSANEWLLENVPYNRATLSILATPASPFEQEYLAVPEQTSILHVERATWQETGPVTFVTISYQPGHRIISSTTS